MAENNLTKNNGTKKNQENQKKKNLNQMDEITTEHLREVLSHILKVLGEPSLEYKDRVFRMLLNEPKVALEVYNAMNDTVYDNPDDLTITTLENATYMGMRNDVSFVIASQLMLYEHQSTVNKNMPLRNLIYVTCIYSVLTRNSNLYGRKMIKLPEPKFVVFYNGTEKLPDVSEQRLSDAYEKHSDAPNLELKITVLNINEGHNQELAAKSPTLHQYMIFVDTIRKYQELMEFGDAVDVAVNECIKNGILSDFLKQNKAEVLRVTIFEYDQEEHMRMEREESLEEGRALGLKEGLRNGKNEEKQATALQMTRMGMSVEVIAQAIRESVDVVQKWLSEEMNIPQ